ncbi:serine/threonine-protein kinase [Patulibacter minatonensis]|uniref:serine/threonine-protein kinase n=1 Tax=Patulibacter minatonensis TaxID=298163 RepID=UPI0004AFD9E2|nr:serine/threonine-protein kinase [Patulibacter minatonensis]
MRPETAATDAPRVVPPAMEDAAPTAARLPGSGRPPRPVAGSDREPGDLVLGRYELVRILGRGGAGTVWMAEDRNLGRPVAVKCLPSEGGARALAEGRAAARLSHPTVVGTYGLGSADGCTWLVTEFVAGDTLRRTIADDTHTDDELLQIGVSMCVALRHAHAHGIVHRDVTPRNVLVPADAFGRGGAGAPAGTVAHPHVPPAKLADFGIARPTDVHEETRKGRIVGTLSYMAPERLTGGPGDEAGDLWALGVVLHEAFVGEHPAGKPERAGALVRAHADLPSLRPRRPDLPGVVLDAVDRAVEEEPGARGSVEELERALRTGLAERGVPIAPVLREQHSHEADAVARPRRSTWSGGRAEWDRVRAVLDTVTGPRTPLLRAAPVAAGIAALAGAAGALALTIALVASALTAALWGTPRGTVPAGSRRLAAGLLVLAGGAAAGGLVVGPLVGVVAGGAAVVLGPVLAGASVVAAGGWAGRVRAPRSIR